MSDNKSQSNVVINRDILDRMFQFGVAIIIGTLTLSLSRDRISDLWPPSNSPTYYSKLLSVVLLFVIIFLLVFRWILSVMREMQMLKYYMKDDLKSQPVQMYVWTVLFSVLLGAMASFSNHIIVCSAVFAIFFFGDVWGQKIRNTQLITWFAKIASDKSENSQKEHLDAIKRYYLERPQIERAVTLMFFSFAGLLSAEASFFQPETTTGAWLGCLAYSIVIVNITIGELIIFRWRRARDKVLGKVWSF